MTTLHVKRGIEFRTDAYDASDPIAWLKSVGDRLETKRIVLKLGDGASVCEVRNAKELVAAYRALNQIALAQGSTLKSYVEDLLQALDDVVKPTSQVDDGFHLDLTHGSAISKMIGLSDGKRGSYGLKSDGEIDVVGVRLWRDAEQTKLDAPQLPRFTSGLLSWHLGELRKLTYNAAVYDSHFDEAEARDLLQRVIVDGVVDPREIKTIVQSFVDAIHFDHYKPGTRRSWGAVTLLLDELRARAPDALDVTGFAAGDGSVRWDLFLKAKADATVFDGTSFAHLDGGPLLAMLNETLGREMGVSFTWVYRTRHGHDAPVRLKYEKMPSDGHEYSIRVPQMNVASVKREMIDFEPAFEVLFEIGKPAIGAAIDALQNGDVATAARAIKCLEEAKYRLSPPQGNALLGAAVEVAGGSALLARILALGADPNAILARLERGNEDARATLHRAMNPRGEKTPSEPERARNIACLLAHGANPNSELPGPGYGGNNGFVLPVGGATPLLMLSLWKHEGTKRQVATALLDAGADPNLWCAGASLASTGLSSPLDVKASETPYLHALRLSDPLASLYAQRGGVRYDIEAEKRVFLSATGDGLRALLARPDVRHDLGPISSRFLHSSQSAYGERSYLELLQAGLRLDAKFRGIKGVPEGASAAYYELTNAASDETRLVTLLGLGVPIDLRSNGRTALLDASCDKQRTTAIKNLIKHGADVNARDERGNTPLINAIYGQVWDVSALLEAGADVNAVNDSGRTPLFYAAARADAVLVAKLIALGADPNVAIQPTHPALGQGSHRGLPLWAAILAMMTVPKELHDQQMIPLGVLEALVTAPSTKIDLGDPAIKRVLENAKQVPELAPLVTVLLAGQKPAADPLARDPNDTRPTAVANLSIDSALARLPPNPVLDARATSPHGGPLSYRYELKSDFNGHNVTLESLPSDQTLLWATTHYWKPNPYNTRHVNDPRKVDAYVALMARAYELGIVDYKDQFGAHLGAIGAEEAHFLAARMDAEGVPYLRRLLRAAGWSDLSKVKVAGKALSEYPDVDPPSTAPRKIPDAILAKLPDYAKPGENGHVMPPDWSKATTDAIADRDSIGSISDEGIKMIARETKGFLNGGYGHENLAGLRFMARALELGVPMTRSSTAALRAIFQFGVPETLATFQAIPDVVRLAHALGLTMDEVWLRTANGPMRLADHPLLAS